MLNQRNKPSPLILDKSGNLIGQRAAQFWCLIRYFPLIIDDLILNKNLSLQLNVISLLLKIMTIIFSSRITETMVTELEQLVEKHHILFKKHFDHTITPKLHFMIHYGTVIRKMGPLVNLWCMRYEAKHAILKNMCRQIKITKIWSKL